MNPIWTNTRVSIFFSICGCAQRVQNEPAFKLQDQKTETWAISRIGAGDMIIAHSLESKNEDVFKAK